MNVDLKANRDNSFECVLRALQAGCWPDQNWGQENAKMFLGERSKFPGNCCWYCSNKDCTVDYAR